jgi:PadR family transcriptional regulator, regulatory protein PadR
MSEVRMTLAVLHVLREFTDDVTAPRYGYDLMNATGYPSGKLYPILARLTAAGWLDREQEDIRPSIAGRPARYTYTLTRDGAVRARQILAEHRAQLAPADNARSSRTPGSPA